MPLRTRSSGSGCSETFLCDGRGARRRSARWPCTWRPPPPPSCRGRRSTSAAPTAPPDDTRGSHDMPVRYIEQVRLHFPDPPPYQWSTYETSPLTPQPKPLSRCRIALLSSSGIYHKDQAPFDDVKNDLSWREIATDVDPRDLRISHFSKNAKAVTDVNTVFPVSRLRELVAEGFGGELAPPAFTFM